MAKKPPSLDSISVRQVILEQSKRANVGHIGCCLSVSDILIALYGHVMNIPSPTAPNRDRFILSKGHAALALYVVLCAKGFISEEYLDGFMTNDTQLGVHPEYGVPGVELATGSLGHGLSTAAGVALAGLIGKKPYHVFALLSDAECNEGSTWEAIMFSAHHGLKNLTAVLDLNGQQGFGYTKDVLKLTPMADKWRDFGWEVVEADGHNIEQLSKVLKPQAKATKPTLVIAHTTFGKGVSFMQSKIDWHYLPMSDDQYVVAQGELAAEELA